MQFHRPFTRQIALWVALAILLLSAVGLAVLITSAREADNAALERQRHLMEHVIDHSRAAVAREQEASTIWDDAIVQLNAATPDADWLDSNLGIWFGTYYLHDEVYVLRAADGPIYAMRANRRLSARTFEERSSALSPIVTEVREKLRRGDRPEGNASSVGATRVALIDGRPALISAKPIVAETEEVAPLPGRDSIHIAVRYLDGSYAENLEETYFFEGVNFVRTVAEADGGGLLPIRASGGELIGYFTWTPDRPGAAIVQRLAPTLSLVLLVLASIIVILLRRVGRSSVLLAASEAQAHRLAYQDALTGLPNRARFDLQLEQALAAVRRQGQAMALLYLDLDRFKAVNDGFGHPVGDALIQAAAERLRTAVRDSATVARIGGDEFAVIAPNLDGEDELEQLCQRIVRSFQEPFDIEGLIIHSTVSLGAATAPIDAVDGVELTRKADIALYEAKTGGRRRAARFVPTMDAMLQRRREIERDLRHALNAGAEIHICFQPLVSAGSGTLAGVEALARWHHPARGSVPPSIFIPIAEETGLIEKLGLFVLREACRAVAPRSIPSLAINISPVQLRSPAFAEQLLALLDQTNMAPDRLELELTETCLVGDSGEYRSNITRLREHGVRIALDDFGTGYSSLTHLRDFEIDRVKIDRSFIADIEKGADSRAIVKAIVELARATRLAVTAEGVETAFQRQFLRDIGCNELQGFLLGRPMNLRELDQYSGRRLIAA